MHKKVAQALTEQLDAIEQALVDARDALQFDIGGNFVPDLTKAAEMMEINSKRVVRMLAFLSNNRNAKYAMWEDHLCAKTGKYYFVLLNGAFAVVTHGDPDLEGIKNALDAD